MTTPEVPGDTRPTITPREQLPVTYFGSVVLAARHPDGSIALAVRDLCEMLGVNRSSQMRRIEAHADLRQGLVSFWVQTAGGPQPQEFLQLEKVPAWLLGISSRRTSDATQDKLRHLQAYLVQEVYAAFARLAGLAEQGSRQIEDLEDLRRMDLAVNALAERQARIEQSQDRAREAWRDLSAQIRELAGRMAEVEQRVGGTITRAQRGHLYQLVQAWGAARAEKDARIRRSAAFQAVWAAFKVRFQLARYEDLPVARYREAVQFINDNYRALTGSDLDLPEQGELELE